MFKGILPLKFAVSRAKKPDFFKLNPALPEEELRADATGLGQLQKLPGGGRIEPLLQSPIGLTGEAQEIGEAGLGQTSHASGIADAAGVHQPARAV